MNTGELIRKYRMDKGMKQVELAEKTGIVVSTIRQYELGFRKPKIDRIKEIADALGVPFDCLLEFDTEKCKEKTLADFTTEEILEEMKRRIESNCVKSVLKQNDKKRDITR